MAAQLHQDSNIVTCNCSFNFGQATHNLTDFLVKTINIQQMLILMD